MSKTHGALLKTLIGFHVQTITFIYFYISDSAVTLSGFHATQRSLSLAIRLK